MLKKFIVIFIVIFLAISPTFVYASNPVDALDDRMETENLAGITWDQINEMSQNSPNSLSPIQGLVLWMFAILAFLKLAQKMDSLLQSLGLNVTQTGGRAVGDLIMAGMALKHVGGAFSRGMGMLGFGGRGGGSPSGGVPSGSSTGHTGAVPIPTSSPGSGVAPVGSSPIGGTSPSGRTSSSGMPTAAASSATPHGTPAGAGYRTPASAPTGGNANDSFPRGVANAALKGGVVGAGIYTAKTGAAKVGEMVSARMADKGISSDSNNELPNNNNATLAKPLPDDGVGISSGENKIENPEGYHDAQPIGDTDEQQEMPTAINTEGFHDVVPVAPHGGSVKYTHANNEEYMELGNQSDDATAMPIPVSTGDITPESAEVGANMEAWQSTNPINDSSEVRNAPSVVNTEGWHDSKPLEKSVATVSTTGVGAKESVQAPLLSNPTAMNSAVVNQKPHTMGANEIKSSAGMAHGTSVQYETAEAPQTDAATVDLGGDSSHTTQTSPIAPSPIITSSDTPMQAPMYENHNNEERGFDGGYDTAPAPIHTPVISSGVSDNSVPMEATQEGNAGHNIAVYSPTPETTIVADTPQITHNNVESESIRMEAPVSPHSGGILSSTTSDTPFSMQNTTPQTNESTTYKVTQAETTTQQPAIKIKSSPRPTEKGTAKNTSGKGRKRRR
ncbi:MAG: hypothetical protein FWC16_04725 [Defluviitaleaceae bacterium]|nr:hypothetical protein [Defluviitaleaceae bacterium]